LASRTPVVAIIGAGMSGLLMGIRLKAAGIDTFTIHEKASEVGGTWRENTYPGLSCDVPSRFYSYSFEPNPDWTRCFSPGAEIQEYFERVTDKYGLRPHIRFGTQIVRAGFENGRWHLRTGTGEHVVADFLVCATGILHHPRHPDIPGLERFAGTAFHSARWDHSVEVAGRRVALIGTGSTGVQITSAIASTVGRLLIFQRTPQWIFPMPNLRYSRLTRAALRRSGTLNRLAYRGWQTFMETGAGQATVRPCWQRSLFSWICRQWLRTVRDPELRRRLTPDHRPMCKRLVVSSGYFRAMQRPNVDLIAQDIDHVVEEGIVTRDGVLHKADVIVFATGFDAHAYMRPIELVGDRGITLEEAWRDGPRGYLTVALPGFPNLFTLVGPHSPFGNQSVISIAEAQVDYVMKWLRMFQDGRVHQVAPTEEATTRFNEDLRGAMPATIWVTGCKSWYLGKDGIPVLWPWTPARHRELLAEPVLEDFALRDAAGSRVLIGSAGTRCPAVSSGGEGPDD
jgi:cation diffusion facilitator CzcD-associated flavoprotein CzcO